MEQSRALVPGWGAEQWQCWSMYGGVLWYPEPREWDTAVSGVPEDRSPYSNSFSSGEQIQEMNSRYFSQIEPDLVKTVGDFCSKGCKCPQR